MQEAHALFIFAFYVSIMIRKSLPYGSPILTENVVIGLFYLTICVHSTIPATADDPDGYLSIDCGNTGGQYIDPTTSLLWKEDGSYVQTGKNGNILDQSIIPSDAANYLALKTFRYFPPGLQKYCYELPTPNENTSFLIRAMFMYENSSVLGESLRFEVYINANPWIVVQYGFGDENDFPRTEPMVLEGMFLNHQGKRVNVCFVPHTGVPFISSLELRKMDLAGSVYADAFVDENRRGYGDFLLLKFARWNLGESSATTSLMRYPNDTYDRFWESTGYADTDFVVEDDFVPLYNVQNLSGSTGSQKNYNSLPYSLLKSGQWVESQAYLNIEQNLPVLTFNSFAILILYVSTNQKTVGEFLRNTFNLPWGGDPCHPVAYDGITCTSAFYEPGIWRFNSLTLSYLKRSGRLISAPPSSTDFTLQLSKLSITHSNLSVDVVQYLLNNVTFPFYLRSLNLSYNNISYFFSLKLNTSTFGNLLDVDLSHNRLTEAPSFKNLSFLFGQGGDLHKDISLYANNNTISGELNLTIWHQKLWELSQNSSNINESGSIVHHLFSFAHNDISAIIPSVEHIEFTIDINHFISLFQKFEAGILLGGNPYCQRVKTNFQSFLCRSSTKDSFGIPPMKKNYIPIILGVSIPGGVLLLIGGLVSFLAIWKLRKQVLVLKQFQQVLLSKNVKPPFFTYHELKIATKNFHDDNSLGEGGFGAVYKGTLQNETEVAVKRLFHTSQQAKLLDDFLNEVVLLTGIKHKNLVQLLGCCINDSERILVYEFAEGGNVADSLWGMKLEGVPLSWKERLNICLGTARGLSYLHEELQPRIIHRDIKAANVRIDKNHNPKIADFGLAIPLQDEETRAQTISVAGTKGYLSPEYVMEGVLTEKVDVYSFGVLVLEIVSGRKCVDLNRPPDEVSLKSWAETMQEQGNVLGILQPALQGECPHDEVVRVIQIALLCVDMEPKTRPTMSQVVTMLTGITEDALFLSLTEKRRFLHKPAVRFEAENESREDLSNAWASLIAKQKESSTQEKGAADYGEDEALLSSSGPPSSFSITSSDAGTSSSSGAVMKNFRKSKSAFSKLTSFGRH